MRHIIIRRAVPADASLLLPLVAKLHEHEGIPTDARTETALRHLLADPTQGFVLLAEAPVLVGYIVIGFGYSLEFAGRDAFVDEAFVAPASRGQGIGTRLMAAAEDACREQGVAALHLEVDHGNPDARRLYERGGYESHKRHLMTKWLRPLDG